MQATQRRRLGGCSSRVQQEQTPAPTMSSQERRRRNRAAVNEEAQQYVDNPALDIPSNASPALRNRVIALRNPVRVQHLEFPGRDSRAYEANIEAEASPIVTANAEIFKPKPGARRSRARRVAPINYIQSLDVEGERNSENTDDTRWVELVPLRPNPAPSSLAQAANSNTGSTDLTTGLMEYSVAMDGTTTGPMPRNIQPDRPDTPSNPDTTGRALARPRNSRKK